MSGSFVPSRRKWSNFTSMTLVHRAAPTSLAADMEKAQWRQFFEGRSVDLLCLHNSRGNPVAWNKACDELGNVFRALGADINAKGVQLSTSQTQTLLKGEIPPALGAGGRPLLGVLASGR